MTRTIDRKDAEKQLPDLLLSAFEGDEIIIEDNGVPKVRIVPVKPQLKRVPNLNKDAVLYISDDFNAPLPDAFWLGDKDETAA